MRPAITVSTDRPTSIRWLLNLANSTVGMKYMVALTGLALTGFVFTHLLGNLQLFLGRDSLNKYAHGLKALGPLLWIARGGLLAVFVTHLALALRLKKRSMDARPVKYVFEKTVQASWVSRYMILSGLVILAFVVFHLMHYTFGWIDRVRDTQSGVTTNYLALKDPVWKDPTTGESRHDVYYMVIDGFRNVPISVAYIVCQILLGMHLLHGIRSIFQTLGLNHSKINRPLTLLSYGATATLISGNIAMPVAVMLRLVGGDIP